LESLERWVVLLNTGGIGVFAWVVHRTLVRALDGFTVAAVENGKMLAVLIDRVKRPDE